MMLSTAENERLTRVGPGTPMGELMRRYWQPVAVTADLNARPTRPVRILGEDLVLYRDKSGTLGLIERASARIAGSISPTAYRRSTACAACTTAG